MYEWAAHSYFSFLQGCASPEELVEKAARAQYQALAITDFDGLYGAAKAYKAYRKLDTSMRLIYGADLHVFPDHKAPLHLQRTVVLLAKTKRGYAHLCQILSAAHANVFLDEQALDIKRKLSPDMEEHQRKGEAFLPLEAWKNFALEDLVALLPVRGWYSRDGAGGALDDSLEKTLSCLKDYFPSAFYLCIGKYDTVLEDGYGQRALAMAEQWNLPFVITQDCFLLEETQKSLHDLKTAMRLNQTMDEVSFGLLPNATRRLLSAKDYLERYQEESYFKKAEEHAAALRESFSFCLSELRYEYPKEWVPKGMSSKAYLYGLVRKGLQSRYGGGVEHTGRKDVEELFQKEMQLVSQLKFEDYFLTVWDIVCEARRRRILCQGRGSAANSILCYALGITPVDPLRFSLLFERFLCMERGTPPDIDIDFEHERREEMVAYIYQKYGHARAAMVCNVIYYRKRSAVREVGKALGVPDAVLGEASQLLSRRQGKKLPQALREAAERSGVRPCIVYFWQKMSYELLNHPKHLGIHSGGFVMSQTKLSAVIPIEAASMSGRFVVQWDKEDLEDLGFFKVDFLCLGMLTAIRKCSEWIEREPVLLERWQRLTQKEHAFDPEQGADLYGFDFQDQQTYKLLQQANTVGVFQVESRAQMSMLPRLKPASFYDIVIEIAIIRPGPIQGKLIHPYLKRRNGLEHGPPLHPKIASILKRTLGIPLFQEQVMRVALEVGDFTPGEADTLRRKIGAWQIKDDFQLLLGKLRQGMERYQLSPQSIEQILSHIEGFAGYGFPESHAVSFAFIVYVSSFLKAHFPEVFFISILNSQPMGFYTPHSLLRDAQKNGVMVLPLCIESSSWDYTLEFRQSRLAIREGFRAIKGLGKKQINRMVEKRGQGWGTFEAFLQGSALDQDQILLLAASDAFAVWGLNRPSAYWLSLQYPMASLLEESCSYQLAAEKIEQAVQHDFKYKGTSFRAHPVALLKQSWEFEQPSVHELLLFRYQKKQRSGCRLSLFGMVIIRQSPPSAKGMVFITLEDETDLANLVFQPDLYGVYQHWIEKQAFLCVEGILQKMGQACSILVQKVCIPKLPEAVQKKGAQPSSEKNWVQSRDWF